MIRTLTIRLYPTLEQEQLMRQHIGAQRFIYNWGLTKNNELYKQQKEKYSTNELGKMLTQFKKEESTQWLNDVSYATLKEALRNLDKAYNNFYKKRAKLPQFKSKKSCSQTFYSRYEKIKFTETTVNLEKIGKMRYRSSYKIDLTQIIKFSNPTVSFTGRCWVLKVGIQQEPNITQLEDKVLAIDLGIKQLAIINRNGLDTPNINKTRVVKDLEKKLKRLQRQCSKKYILNKKGCSCQKTKNIAKLELKIKKLHRKLKNIRLNHVHQSTSKIVKTKPFMIVMEDLCVSSMMKNKHLAKQIQQQGFATFISQMRYKCEYYGITFIQAPRYFASSKTCSCCGAIKKDLKLSDRTYICESCGFTCDRDKNATYNLANYGLSILN